MSRLELRIPPLMVAAVVAGLMWLVSLVTPPLTVRSTYRIVVAVALIATAFGLVVSALATFRRAGTTVDPTAPERSSKLVIVGVYRFTRNPIYLGMLLALLGFGVLLSSAFAVASSALFVAYMDSFQIGPEERVLADRFGSDYEAYRRSVRRWA